MPRVLVIEDEPSLRKLYRINLEEAGFEVDEAEDGEGGLALARRATYDVVLLDVRLPGMSGWEVAASLLQDDATAEVPIVFLSGAGDVELHEQDELTRFDYLVKPFSMLVLPTYLERVLERAASGGCSTREQRLAVVRALIAGRPGAGDSISRSPCE